MAVSHKTVSWDPIGVNSRLPVHASKDRLATYGLTKSSYLELLEAAGTQVVSMGVGDTTSQIGALVAQLFVAKMHYVQSRLGLPQEATVIQPPDATIQTSMEKFQYCVPEAARVRWGSLSAGPQFIPAETDVDFCGMVTVGLERPLDAVSLAENISAMQQRPRYVEGQEIDANCIQPGNHFANVYEVADHEAHSLPPYIGVAHMASDEYRDRLRLFAEEVAVPMDTPFGTCLAITGGAAQTYWEIAREGAAFAARKRWHIAQEIFRTDRRIADDGHYEFTTPASCVIGCNPVTDPEAYHILVSRASDPAYLVRGTGNASSDSLSVAGLLPENPLFDEMRESGILPHGSGHALIEDTELLGYRLTDSGGIFVTRLNNGAERAVRDYLAVPLQSRGSVLGETLHWGLVRPPYATLHPLCSVKA